MDFNSNRKDEDLFEIRLYVFVAVAKLGCFTSNYIGTYMLL